MTCITPNNSEKVRMSFSGNISGHLTTTPMTQDTRATQDASSHEPHRTQDTSSPVHKFTARLPMTPLLPLLRVPHGLTSWTIKTHPCILHCTLNTAHYTLHKSHYLLNRTTHLTRQTGHCLALMSPLRNGSLV